MRFKIIVLFVMFLFYGCTTPHKGMYYWGDYSNLLYKYKRGLTQESLDLYLAELHNIIEKSNQLNLRVPPGIYADLNINFDAEPPFSNFNDFCKEGSSYHLKVIVENDTLTATTSIPNATPLDSIWFVPDERYPEYGDFYIWYDDPDTMGNNVMFEHKRLAHFALKKKVSRSDDVFIKAFGAVRNDIEGLNGEAFVSFFERGRSSNFTTTGFTDHKASFANFQSAYYNDTIGEVFADTVLFRFSQLDKASFEFWRSVIAQDLMNGNPFAEPINLKSNINGGLGVFEGKAAVYYKLIAREDTTFTERSYPGIFDFL